MKPNPNLDELLSSFIDGELSPRQRTEVQRMAAHDVTVARRLQQLQNCRTVFCSLPPSEAPGDLLEQIKQSLERKTLLQEQPVVARRSLGGIHLVFRKFLSAAAMISLLAVLGAVVYQIVSPVPGPSGSSTVAVDNPIPTKPVVTTAMEEQTPAVTAVVAAADAGFSGRLELQTASFASTDAFVKRAIGTCGLVDLGEADVAGDRRTYRVVGTRDDVTRLVASLGDVWDEFSSVALHVDRPQGGDPVTIEAVMPNQVEAVIARGNAQASVQTAEAYAAMNHMSQKMPGGELSPVIAEDPGNLWAMEAIPMPKLTGPEDSKEISRTPVEGSPQASLTIVLLRTTK
ncbi:MAG: anti-sigma factor family protein [Solirubrobacterales bacterium]